MVYLNHRNSMLTAAQVARLLNVHINTVRRWSNLGILKAYRIGTRGDRRFSKDEVARFLADRSQPQRKAEIHRLPRSQPFSG
jgi:excisionase family DNA binding protein